MSEINLRIGIFQLRKSNNFNYEVVKWYPNEHYNKKDEYTLSDKKHALKGKFYHKENENYYIEELAFDKKELCYVVVDFIKDSEGYYLKAVGSRMFELEEDEKDFFIFIKKCDKLLNETNEV